jgi:hypothetical protein
LLKRSKMAGLMIIELSNWLTYSGITWQNGYDLGRRWIAAVQAMIVEGKLQ